MPKTVKIKIKKTDVKKTGVNKNKLGANKNEKKNENGNENGNVNGNKNGNKNEIENVNTVVKTKSKVKIRNEFTGSLFGKYKYDTREECMKHKIEIPDKKYRFQKTTMPVAFDDTQFYQMIINPIKKESLSENRDASKCSVRKGNLFGTGQMGKMFDKMVNDRFGMKAFGVLDQQSLLNTLHYVFYKMKAGIFVRIRGGDVKMFVPFHNINFKNDWGNLVKLDPDKYRNFKNFVNKQIESESFGQNWSTGKKRGKAKWMEIDKRVDKWAATGCMIRHEFRKTVNPSYWLEIYDMFRETCHHRVMPNIDFVVNKKDNPLLKLDLTEPYEDIFGVGVEMKKQKYETYWPILSQTVGGGYADLGLPTNDDWMMITGKFFVNDCKNGYIGSDEMAKEVAWKDKKDVAFFRGKGTGCGLGVEDNQRLRLADLAWKWKEGGGVRAGLLDAGITKFVLRSKKVRGRKFMNFTDKRDFEFDTVGFVPMAEQVGYKYLLNVEGNGAAYRLGQMMGMGCVIMIVESRWKVWFENFLEPMKHYVPIKSDLSDLEDKILWLRKHDKEAKKIAGEAMKFYKKYLGRDGVFDYVQKMAVEMCKKI